MLERVASRRGVVVAVTAVVVVLLVFFVGCTAPSADLLPAPSSTASTSTAPTTSEPDYSRIPLPVLPGETTTTAPIERGDATVRGVVVGPDGAVPGAIVRIERLVGDAVQRTDVVTDGNGGFASTGIPGGRYRVRAFLAPRLTMDDPEIFFVEDGGDRELRLDLTEFSGLTVTAGTTPEQPIVGDGVNLAVRVSERVVDGDGVGRATPRADIRVEVRVTGWTELDEEPVGRTDADGVVVFSFRCDEVGEVSASAEVGRDRELVTFEVPPCAPEPTTTTSEPDPDGDDSGQDGSSSTTTTTAEAEN